MLSFSKILSFIGVAVAVLLAGVAVGWLATRRPVSERPLTTPLTPSTRSAWTNPGFFAANSRTRPSQSVSNKVVTPAPGPVATNLITDWETRLDEILGADGDEPSKARQMLAIFRNLPPEGQVEAA